MISSNNYQNYLNFDDAECCEINEFQPGSLNKIVLNEDSLFYVQNECPVQEIIENEQKAQYVPRFEDGSIERFRYFSRSKSPIGNVTIRVAKNWSRENQSGFLECDTATSPSFIQRVCQNSQLLIQNNHHMENRNLNEESKNLQSHPIDGEVSDIDSELADEASGDQIVKDMQDKFSGTKFSDLQKRVIELQKFLDSLNFGDKKEWEIYAGMNKKNYKRDSKMKPIARKTTCDAEEDTFSSSLDGFKYPRNQGYQGRRKGENGYEDSANDANLLKVRRIKSFGEENKSTKTLDSKLYACSLCNREFSKNGLGGHMSRAHPGESKNYKHKKDTRDLREQDRTLLRRAQEEYKIRYGKLNISNREIDRKNLELIKNEIRRREEY